MEPYDGSPPDATLGTLGSGGGDGSGGRGRLVETPPSTQPPHDFEVDHEEWDLADMDEIPDIDEDDDMIPDMGGEEEFSLRERDQGAFVSSSTLSRHQSAIRQTRRNQSRRSNSTVVGVTRAELSTSRDTRPTVVYTASAGFLTRVAGASGSALGSALGSSAREPLLGAPRMNAQETYR